MKAIQIIFYTLVFSLILYGNEVELQKPIKMCVDPDWEPYEKINENKHHEGIAADLIRLVSNRSGIPIELLVTKDWDESLEASKSGKCEIMSFLNQTPKREEWLIFTEPIFYDQNVIITHETHPFISDIGALTNETVVLPSGTSIEEKLRKDFPNVIIITVKDEKECFDMVSNKKADMTIRSLTAGGYAIKQNGYFNLKIAGQINGYQNELKIGVLKSKISLRDTLNKAVQSITPQEREQIVNKYISIKIEQGMNYKLIFEIVLGALFLLILFGYWNRRLSSLNKELSEAKLKADLATQSKSDFLANMSHEIRTPMNGIIGMAHLALHTEDNTKQKKYLNQIDESAKILLGIINDILDFSKIEANKLEVENINFDMKKIIANVKNLLEDKAYEKGLQFTIIYDEDESFYLGDPLRIGQVLINLMTNAIKFTSDGFVELKIQKVDSNKLKFIISDSGVGIEKNNINKLFSSFTQEDSSTTRKFGGTGLGLTISKQLVELMGGEIFVTTKLGVGSEFSFILPLSKGVREEQIGSKQELEELQKELYQLSGSKILLVEDNSTNSEIVIGLLEDTNILIDVASNGLEAVQLFKHNRGEYELILMDIHMPIMDGFEATKIIKEIDNNIPIIALSANVMRSDIEKTLNGGMLEHLNKPIDVNKLYTILLKYIPKKIEKQTFNSQNESENQSKKEVYIPSFKNIDTKIGLTHMRLNKNLYLKTLQNFYKEFNNIELQEFDHNTLILKLHTIKGLSASIGAMKLFEIVNQFEFSSDKNVLFLVDKELKKVLVELEKLTKEERYNKIEKIKITKGTRNELFINLKDAILKRRPRNIEYIIGKIEVFELNDVDTIAFREIKKAVESYDYSKALSTIDIYQ